MVQLVLPLPLLLLLFQNIFRDKRFGIKSESGDGASLVEVGVIKSALRIVDIPNADLLNRWIRAIRVVPQVLWDCSLDVLFFNAVFIYSYGRLSESFLVDMFFYVIHFFLLCGRWEGIRWMSLGYLLLVLVLGPVLLLLHLVRVHHVWGYVATVWQHVLLWNLLWIVGVHLLISDHLFHLHFRNHLLLGQLVLQLLSHLWRLYPVQEFLELDVFWVHGRLLEVGVLMLHCRLPIIHCRLLLLQLIGISLPLHHLVLLLLLLLPLLLDLVLHF